MLCQIKNYLCPRGAERGRDVGVGWPCLSVEGSANLAMQKHARQRLSTSVTGEGKIPPPCRSQSKAWKCHLEWLQELFHCALLHDGGKKGPQIAQQNIASRGRLHVLVNASVSTPVLWDESQGIITSYFRPPPKQHIMNQKRLKE